MTLILAGRLVAAGAVLTLLVALSHGARANGGELRGAARAIDGDTLALEGQSIDLYGVTAPQFNQQCRSDRLSWSCGRAAARALDRLVAGRAVACAPHGEQGDAAIIARCEADGLDLAEAMVERGFAVAWRKVEPYASAEQGARALRLGIWRDGDIDPWLWRPDGN